MQLTDFLLERYFSRWEFACEHLLCASGVQGWGMAELLALADAPLRAQWDGLSLGYTEAAGHPQLRARLASAYGLAAEEVLCFAGAEEGIFTLLSTLLGAGDHVVVVRPAYQSLFEVARAAGAELSEVWLRHEDGFQLDVGRIAAALRPSTRLVIVNFPHNPTGAMIDATQQAELIALVERHGAYLLSDEAYRGLERDPSSRLAAAVTRSPRALSLGSTSKALGLAGLRIGWLACRDAALLRRVAARKDYGSMCNAAPSELLALIALAAEPAVLARAQAIVRPNLAAWDAFLARQRDILACVPSQGGVTAFPRFVDETVDIDAFCDALVRETGVLLLPGSIYGAAGPHFRVGMGRTDFTVGLDKLERHLEARRS